MDKQELIKLAFEAREHSYSPYSGFCMARRSVRNETPRCRLSMMENGVSRRLQSADIRAAAVRRTPALHIPAASAASFSGSFVIPSR